ncbi:MAG: hypothetical protein RR595_10630 [Lysinibacillus sp.]
MNTQKNGWSKFFFAVSVILLLLIGGTIFVISELMASSIPDEKEEEKIVAQAEQYLQERYPNMNYEVSYVIYDSGEQYGNFDYAAMILDKETQKSFMVYENRYTEKMEDDLSIQEATEFIKQVQPKVYSYIEETFGETKGMAFTPSSDVGGIPTLNIWLNNKKEEINEEMFLSLTDYL